MRETHTPLVTVPSVKSIVYLYAVLRAKCVMSHNYDFIVHMILCSLIQLPFYETKMQKVYWSISC